jgi:hypothetical protein
MAYGYQFVFHKIYQVNSNNPTHFFDRDFLKTISFRIAPGLYKRYHATR